MPDDERRNAKGAPLCGARAPCKLLSLLSEISTALARETLNRAKMVQDVFEVLSRHLKMSRATIMLLTTDGGELIFEEAQETPSRVRTNSRYRRGEGIIGQVLDTGEAIVVPSISRDPRYKGRIHDRKADALDHGFICVPVVQGSETVGTFSVDVPPDRSAHCLTEWCSILVIVADMIAHDVGTRRIARMEREALSTENERLRDELRDRFRPDNMIGNSNEMRDVFLRIHRVAAAETTVLIRGESGTGKEPTAAAVHYNSPRSDRPFVKVNCAALSENLLESELFGHEKGAFTGAVAARTGRIEEAEGGTLFLDEIGDFSPAVQVKLLRVLQEREYERVGSNKTRKANVRIVAATNRELEQAVEEGSFRADLYYRINVFSIHLPPLRHRRNDILLLANHFMEKFTKSMGRDIRRISTPAINMLMAYHWPGNVRELENCIEHAMLLAEGSAISGPDLPPTLQMPEPVGGGATFATSGTLKDRVHLLERELIVDGLKRNSGNVTAVARELGITPRMVRYKIQGLGIKRQPARVRTPDGRPQRTPEFA